MLRTIPLVNEANAICDEIGNNMHFTVKLMTNQRKGGQAKVQYLPCCALRDGVFTITAHVTQAKHADNDDDDDDDDDEGGAEQLDTAVYVLIQYTDGRLPDSMWNAGTTSTVTLWGAFWW